MTNLIQLLKGLIRQSSFLTLLTLALIAGALTGLVLSHQIGFTTYAAEVESLSEYQPGEITKVFADDGKTVIGELALERRVPLTYEQIPPKMRQAVLAIEDLRFFEHSGIDVIRVGGAVLKNIMTFSRKEGASTLTQQVARMLYLKTEKTWTRKFRELIYALQIERYYTKEQIMTIYCNLVNLGGGAYGVEAASNYYFNKSLKDLSVEECAMLAAIPKSPTNYNPVRNPKAALTRRNLVLESMSRAGFISESESDAAKGRPIKLNLNEAKKSDRGPFAYIIEDVRQEMNKLAEERGAQDAMNVYRAGLSIYTTIDADAQKKATEAVRKQLRRYNRRRGWPSKLENVLDNGGTLEGYVHETWTASTPDKGDVLVGVVKEVNANGAQVSFGNYSSMVSARDTQWTGRTPQTLFKRGDIANFVVNEVDPANKTLVVEVDRAPVIQAGLVLLDARSGEIKAEVGGYDFTVNKFNHAIQAQRQTGSVFKPFIYAAAVEDGLKPDDNVSDSEFTRGGWSPHNYDNQYMGIMPIKKALALSRNIPAVRVLDEVGIRKAENMVHRLGLPNPMAPFLPSALGATEEPLMSMVSAYSTFPNKGVRIEPFRVRKVVDREGRVVYDAEPKEYRVMHEYVAGTMVQMMRGVVQFGTAASINGLQGHELAGKTGTVNDFTDAWFIGYTARYVCGNWIGFSQSKETLGKGESGASAALPFWREFMSQFLSNKPREAFYKVPDPPKEIKDAQRAHDKDRFGDATKLMAGVKGDLNPIRKGSGDITNMLDPLKDQAAPAAQPQVMEKTPSTPVPPPAAAPRSEPPRPRVAPQAEVKPQPTPDNRKKGKKGKSPDDPPE